MMTPMTMKISLIAFALAALAGCSPVPTDGVPVQQLDTATLWSTGSYR